MLVQACSPVAPPPQAQVEEAPASGGEEPDLGCASYYFLCGRYAELSLQFEEALEYYQKAMICDPQASFVAGRVPLLLVRLERPDEALQWLETQLAEHPEDRHIRLLYAGILVQRKAYDKAVEQYRIVFAQSPEDPAPLLLLAELFMGRGLLDQAEKSLLQVLEIDPNAHIALVQLARLLRMSSRPDAAVARYKRALEVDWSAELVLETAQFLASQERFTEAAAMYREVLKAERDNEEVRIALIYTLLLQDQEDEALEELQQLKAVTGRSQQVDVTIARLYARKKQYGKAAAVLEKFLELNDSSQARYLLAIIYFQKQEYAWALAQLHRIDNQAEEYEDALFLQARIYQITDRVDIAVQMMEAAIAKEASRTPEMFALLATLYQLLGEGQKRADAYFQGLSLFPEDDGLLYEFGLFLEQKGDHLEAMKVMQQVITLKPDNAGALNFVGYTWADKKIHLDQALEYIQRAMELQPDNGYIRDSLGWVHYRLGNLELALEHLQEAVRLVDDAYDIYDHLGDVYLEMGMVDKARGAYEKGLALLDDAAEGRALLLQKLKIIRDHEEH